MKNLIHNYIDLLKIDKLSKFLLDNKINLNETELNYIFNLVKNNWEDIINNSDKYLDNLDSNINLESSKKIKDLFNYYKNRYKNYLF